MNNYELNLKFIEIASYNAFDAYIKLKEFKKEYKTSDFYKQTKLSLNQAYKLFLTNLPNQLVSGLKELMDVDILSMKITDVINGVDEDVVNSLVEKFTNVFDISKLQDEKGEMKILLNQFKDLVK